jgi:hypothetical protein
MKIFLSYIFTFLSVVVFSQTITCVNTDSDPNSIFISFSPPAAPCGPFVSYEVWGTPDTTAAFNLIGTINNEATTSFIHVNAFNFGDPWFYYIVFNYNCPGVPAVVSPIATNAFNSHQPDIIRLDVTDDGILIEWAESDYSQTQAYVLSYLLPNGLAQPIDTIYGISTTTYLDENSVPLDPGLVYTLTLLDGCNSQSSFNTIGYRLIVPRTPVQDDCNQLIEYSWPDYINPYNVGYSYNIYISINQDTFELVANQPTGVNTFNLFDFINGDTVRFFVEVIDANGLVRSNSAIMTEIADIVQPPVEFYIYLLTVNSDNQVEIHYYIDTFAQLRNFTIENSKLGTTFQRVERFDASLYPGLGDILSIDSLSDPNRDAFFYRIIANNICNQNFPSSTGRTIWVNVLLEDFFVNDVRWNEFELEDAEVLTYRLYRDYGAGFQQISSFAPGQNSYKISDNVSDYFNERGTFCYKVEADYIFTRPDSSTENYTSSSNIFCIDQRPSVYVPNAIVPEGQNRIFRPMIVFGDPSDYNMKIFNRWGEMIFESNEYTVGWAGDKGGNLVPMGGYPYIITFTAIDGTRVEKKGIVTVIR